MKKALSLILVLSLCMTLCACGNNSTNATAPSSNPLEECYAQLIEYASTAQYLEAWRLCQQNSDVLTYKDSQAYYDYCVAMRAYVAGGLGFAYNKLRTVSYILNAQNIINIIENRISGLDGYYIADNEKGSYLHMVIRDGLVAYDIIPYGDNRNFNYNDPSVHWYELVQSTYNNGAEFLAIGRYSTIGSELTINYVINTFVDNSDILVIKYEGSEFSTMNGLYSKVTDKEQSNNNENTQFPVEGKQYVISLYQQHVGKYLYVNGEMSSYYLATCENKNDAVRFMVEKSGNGYHLYHIKNGQKEYLNIVQNGQYINVVYQSTPSSEYRYDYTLETLVTTVSGVEYFIGSMNQYSFLNLAPCLASDYTSYFIAHLDEV